jgi:hypothetical protein
MTAKTLGAPLSFESIHAQMQERGLTHLTFEDEIVKISDEGELDFRPKSSMAEDGPEPDNGDPRQNQPGQDDDEDDTQDDDGADDAED